VNIERLTELAEWLESGAPRKAGVDGFNMLHFRNESEYCGTTCCICGAAVTWWYPPEKLLADRETLGFNWVQLGAKVLNLDIETAYQLFNPTDVFLSYITSAWAARCIRNLIATGRVDWLGVYEGRLVP